MIDPSKSDEMMPVLDRALAYDNSAIQRQAKWLVDELPYQPQVERTGDYSVISSIPPQSTHTSPSELFTGPIPSPAGGRISASWVSADITSEKRASEIPKMLSGGRMDDDCLVPIGRFDFAYAEPVSLQSLPRLGRVQIHV